MKLTETISASEASRSVFLIICFIISNSLITPSPIPILHSILILQQIKINISFKELE